MPQQAGIDVRVVELGETIGVEGGTPILGEDGQIILGVRRDGEGDMAVMFTPDEATVLAAALYRASIKGRAIQRAGRPRRSLLSIITGRAA